MPSAIFLFTASLVVAFWRGDAAVSMSQTLVCQTIDTGSGSQDVCSTWIETSPSPTQLPNGTAIYLGPYSYLFAFWNGLKNGTDTSTLENIADHANIELSVGVAWENGVCQVQLSGNNCTSCSICADKADPAAVTLSADCTNREGGRIVECEPAFIFYPLTSASTVGIPAAVEDDDKTDIAIDDDDEDGQDDSAVNDSGSLSMRTSGPAFFLTLVIVVLAA